MNQDRIWVLMARKLAEEITPAEQSELEQLLKANPDQHFPLQALTDLWKNDRYKPDQEDPEIHDAYFNHIERLNSQASGHNRNKQLRILPYLLTILLVMTVIYFSIPAAKTSNPKNSTTSASEVVTKNGSKTKLLLPDGSRVWLNAKSKITYDEDFNKTDREVQLTGEAFFEVKKDSSKPFIIHIPGMDLRVLGTSFNVKAYPGDHTSEASLITGSLEVSLNSGNKQKIILRPSEKIVVANDSPTKLQPATAGIKIEAPIISIKNITHFKQDDSIIIETSWVKNKLVFQDESFTDIALKMERWYGTAITFGDQQIANLHFTGIFENETLEQALYAMSITEPFRFKKEASGMIINASAKNRTSNPVTPKQPGNPTLSPHDNSPGSKIPATKNQKRDSAVI